MYEDYHTHLKCIKTILEEFGKLLAFVNIPQNASRYEDLEVVYINKNFGAKDVLAIPEIKNALVKMAFNDGVGISSTTKIEISPKIFFQYYLSREGECICVFGKNVTAEVNERILFEKIINTRNEFMGHISHEIRTPLTGIISTIELIENSGKIPPSLQSYVDTLNICSTSLLTLISDLMDLSKMEAGKLELVHSPFNLRGIVDEVLVYLEGDIKSKGVGMNVVIDQRLSQEFIGDGSRMRQILTNLVNNAVKYNIQNGNVNIKISYIESLNVPRSKFIISSDPKKSPAVKYLSPCSKNVTLQTIRFDIVDTGIGIPQEKQSGLFQSFVQLNSNGSGNTYIPTTIKGIGVGLSICKKLVEMMNGSIEVVSVVGKGSTFSFTIRLPIHITDDEQNTRSIANKRILVVDDDATNLSFIVKTLSKFKATCTFFTNAKDAVDICLTNGVMFDLIITDIHLPGLDGVQFSSIIREYGYSTPIIGLSSIDIERVESKHFDAIFQKPMNTIEFLDIVCKLCTQPIPIVRCPSIGNIVATPQTPVSSRHTFTEMNIILVEDDETLSRITQEQLLSFGLNNVVVCVNGEDCLSKIRESVERGTPKYDLVLMDICLAGNMNGIECTKKIRELYLNPPFGIPKENVGEEKCPCIIAVTANTMASVSEEAMKAGVYKILTKPIRMRELKSSINMVYNRK
jgi:signal transduction histidine kinase/DNA-binding response OmpR family regulator